MRLAFTLLALCCALYSLSAQVRFEVDFNTREKGGEPLLLTSFDNRIVFSASDGLTGREPWVYDPAIDRAYQLADINEGLLSSLPREFTVVDDELFFVVINGNEYQLWTLSEGQTQATQAITDSTFRNIESLTLYDGDLYFQGWLRADTDRNISLYKYELATGNTVRILDNPALNLDTSFPAMRVHAGDLYLSTRRVSDNLVVLTRYNTEQDSLSIVSNQITDNEQQVYITDMRSFDDYLVLNIRDPEDLNSGYLGYYDATNNSIVIESTLPLWPANPPENRSIEVVGDRLFFRQRAQNTLLRTYNPASREVQSIDGVPDSYGIIHMQEMNGQLLYTTFTNFSRNVYDFGLVDPETNTVSDVMPTPDLERRWTVNYPGNTFNYFVLLGNDWYYRGFSGPDNGELHRYEPDSGSSSRLTDVHRGNVGSFPSFPMLTGDGRLFYRAGFDDGGDNSRFERIVYDPADRSYANPMPEVEWSFSSKIYSFPGYLIGTLVNYQGQDYDAVAYDSLSQTYVPLTDDRVNGCNPAFRVNGSMITYEDAVYFVRCDGSRNQLFRHEFGVAGSTMVSDFTDRTLANGGFEQETMALFEDDVLLTATETPSDFFNSELLRFDGTTFTTVDLGSRTLREPYVTKSGNGVYFSAVDTSDSNNYIPAYLREGDEQWHPILFAGDTIRWLFPSQFHQSDSSFYFAYNDQVLRHDPSSEEAELIYTLPAELENLIIPYKFGDRLMFQADSDAFGRELYEVVDLEDGEARRVTDIMPGRAFSFLNNLIDLDDRLFFNADDGFRGRELWSYQPGCFTIDVTTSPSNINWPTGEATAAPEGGIAPFTYAWNTGDSTATITNLAAGFYEVTITDAAGCSISQNNWVETNGVINSINEARAERISAVVFPNPMGDRLQLRFDGELSSDYTLRIFDLNGRLLTTSKVNAATEFTLDVSQLPAGQYVVQLLGADGRSWLVQRVVKG